MTRANHADEDDPESDDDWNDDEPLDDDPPEDDDWPTVLCPHCRAEIAEESVQCPHCGIFLSREDAPRQPRSTFWLVMMLLALAVMAMWLLLV